MSVERDEAHITVDDRRHAARVARAELRRSDGLAVSGVAAAQAVASLALVELVEGVDQRRARDRHTVALILAVVRQQWESPQQELDAVYESLRQAGHAV